MSEQGVNRGRRRFLTATTSVVGAVGVGFAAVPFIKSWEPSAKAQAIGAPVQVDVGRLEPGQLMKVAWRGQTIGILRRTDPMLDSLDAVADELRDPDSIEAEQPAYIEGADRSLKPQYLVINMHCTHLGCVPALIPEAGPQPWAQDWQGGFFCPCHKSKFDLSGRVYSGVPAPTNLRIPPYSYVDDTTLMIGVDPEGAA